MGLGIDPSQSCHAFPLYMGLGIDPSQSCHAFPSTWAQELILVNPVMPFPTWAQELILVNRVTHFPLHGLRN